MDQLKTILDNVEKLVLREKIEEAKSLVQSLEQMRSGNIDFNEPISLNLNNLEELRYQIFRWFLCGREEDRHAFVSELLKYTRNWCMNSCLFEVILYFASVHGYNELFIKTYCYAFLIRGKHHECYDQYINSKLKRDVNKPICIFQGTINIANQMTILTEALRERQVCARSFSLEPTTYLKYHVDEHHDFLNFENDYERDIEVLAFIGEVVFKYDVFHFHFGVSILGENLDLELLKRFNKKIIMQHWGSDIRRFDIAKKITPYDVSKFNKEDILRSLQRLKNYVDICIVADHELYEYVKGYYDNIEIVPIAIDLKKFKAVGRALKNKDDKLIIVHAPTAPLLKGTPHVERAINNLLLKGYKIDYRRVEGVSNEVALKMYKESDLSVDQLLTGQYGYFALENMAMGTPVITYICDYMKDHLPCHLPIISANTETIEGVLEFYLNHLQELPKIGKESRRYVEEQHDINHVVDQYIRIYHKVLQES